MVRGKEKGNVKSTRRRPYRNPTAEEALEKSRRDNLKKARCRSVSLARLTLTPNDSGKQKKNATRMDNAEVKHTQKSKGTEKKAVKDDEKKVVKYEQESWLVSCGDFQMLVGNQSEEDSTPPPSKQLKHWVPNRASMDKEGQTMTSYVQCFAACECGTLPVHPATKCPLSTARPKNKPQETAQPKKMPLAAKSAPQRSPIAPKDAKALENYLQSRMPKPPTSRPPWKTRTAAMPKRTNKVEVKRKP